MQRVVEYAVALNPNVVETHFARVRHLSKYLRDFTPDAIGQHLRLLAQLDDTNLVAACICGDSHAKEFKILLAGLDLMGVSACVTGCLTDMGLLIEQFEVITYEPVDGAPGPSAGLLPLSAAEKYVMVFTVRALSEFDSSDALVKKIQARLKAAYWHLVRGNVRQARQEASESDDLVGVVLGQRFRLERWLAQGGMGLVYLATQLELERPVIIKLLRSEFTDDTEFVDSFVRETRLLGNVHSPHMVHVYAAGVDDGRCWMALEYLMGGDVAHWLARCGTPPFDLAARWLADALAGLRYIHENTGLLHCDLKPGNLLLDARHNLKIGDLGLSQLWRLTHLLGADGRVKGTPWYMAPEQARGELLDQRSDLFSLGSTFFHILTGNLPFQGAGVTEVLANVSAGRVQPISDVAPDIPAPLAVIVERLMRPDPLERYQEAAVALMDLESYLRRDLLAPRSTPLSRGRVLYSTRPNENQLPTSSSVDATH